MAIRRLWFVAAAFVVLLSNVKSETCDNPKGKFDCAGKGRHVGHLIIGACEYRCQDGDQILTCEDVYPAPNSTEYEATRCSPNERFGVFNCADRGLPFWSGPGDCRFACRIGDMISYCNEIYAIA